MEKWEIALNKFIDKWKRKREVIGVLVCGSYVTGNPSSHSDIDIQIILKNKVKWRERGNEIIDGFLIEYFANPVQQQLEYFESDYNSRRRTSIHMFQSGKILFDKTGEVNQLVKIAKKYSLKNYPKQNKILIEFIKYHIWDMKDNLEEIYDNKGKEFNFAYFNNLNKLLDFYCKFLRFEIIPIHRIKTFLVSTKIKNKYNVKDFPDSKFVELFINAIELEDIELKMMEFNRLIDYVLNKMGGFDIDGWKVRSLVEK